MWVLKNFGSQKNLGQKKFFGLKEFGSKKNFGSDPFWVQTNFEFQELCLKNPRVKKTLGAKGSTKILVKRIIGLKNVFGPNKFRPPKILGPNIALTYGI